MSQCITYPTKCVDFKRRTYLVCVPPKRICNVMTHDGLLTTCDNVWNCSPFCNNDNKYYVPYCKGDKIMLQTQFLDNVSADRTCPSSNPASAVLCLPDGTTSTAFTSRQTAGWGTCGYSFQTFEIDTSLPIFDDIGCWNVKITSGDQECCSQIFREKKCKEDTVLIEGTYDESDCFNIWYGGSECFVGDSFEFSNKIRLCATLKPYGPESEYQYLGNFKTNVQSKKYFLLQLNANENAALPPFMMCVLQSIFDGKEVFVNGEKYYIDSLPRLLPSSKSAMSSLGSGIVLYQKCDITHGCKN